MTRLFLFALALSCWAFTTTEAFALGSDHPKGPVAGNELWPEGLKDLANRPDRVHGFWVNETDVFFYDMPTLRYLPPMYYWLARAQEGVGATVAAKKFYEQFLSLRAEADPPDALAADARRRIC